jgi:hypothetical protein
MADADEPRFEGKTRAQVEAMLATGNYDEHRFGKGARAWLSSLDQQDAAARAARQEERENKSLKLARDANRIAVDANGVARWAALFAGLALVVAAIALWVSLRRSGT